MGATIEKWQKVSNHQPKSEITQPKMKAKTKYKKQQLKAKKKQHNS